MALNPFRTSSNFLAAFDTSGIKAARKAVMPSVPWQRRQFHLQQNAQSYITKKSKNKSVANFSHFCALLDTLI
jgi:transposase-like protein